MSPLVLQALRQRRGSIQERWETLLRIEPVNTPLALPDAIIRLIPSSLDEVLREIAENPQNRITLPEARKAILPTCGCDRNPYLALFKACEQAVLEELILIQAAQPSAARREQDLADAVRATRVVAKDEIDAFCGLCAHHAQTSHCRHYSSAPA